MENGLYLKIGSPHHFHSQASMPSHMEVVSMLTRSTNKGELVQDMDANQRQTTAPNLVVFQEWEQQ